MKSSERQGSTDRHFKMQAKEIASYAAEIIEQDRSKKGILLCEGTQNSMDVYLYSAIYESLVVVPVGGCSDIRKLMPFMRKYSEYKTFGIVDRDNNSKRKIREMQKVNQIYSTKLPFIENIICCPEVLKIITKNSGLSYAEIIKEVRSGLASILVEKLSLLNPFNVDLPYDKEVQFVSITIVAGDNMVQKTIDLSNVMYTFRDKAIVGKVADAMGFHGREAYYSFLKKELSTNKREKLLFAMAKYLPVIVFEEW